MRILHTMIRVGNLESRSSFYTKALGMQLLRQRDYPDGEFTLAFPRLWSGRLAPAIELTYNYGVSSYELGTGFGHIARRRERHPRRLRRHSASRRKDHRASRDR